MLVLSRNGVTLWVVTLYTALFLLIYGSESSRFHIELLSLAIVLWHSLHLSPYFHRRLRRRLFYGSESAILQPLVGPGQASHQLQDRKVDLCCMYLAIIGTPRIQMDSGLTSHQERRDRCKLSRPAGRASAVHSTWRQRTRLAEVSCLRGSD